MFGFGTELEPYFDDMVYLRIQYIAIDGYNEPYPENIPDEVPHPVNA